ncbi:MAG TPA: GNAT family N-acetyltransferase [Solirubrobacteraceae bacterium]|nr:GNAT family N-acetyltransferase [Solirubrobacteraceae bacterium]
MRLRPPTLADLQEVHAVLEARDRADFGAPDFTLDDLRDAWQRTETDLTADARLVTDQAGAIVGYGIVEGQGALGVVHPESEGRGAGSLLLGWLMDRERERGHTEHRQYVGAANPTAPVLLSPRGFTLTRSNYRMARALDEPGLPPDLPGVTLRPVRPEDVAEMRRVDNRAFAEDPGYVPESLTAFREEHLEAHGAAPDLGRVALIDGEVAGFLIARRWEMESVGYVDVLAVDPGHQGRGIGRALLLEAFSAFRAAGLHQAQLGVSSVNPRALNLYRSAGMTVRFQGDIYERPI